MTVQSIINETRLPDQKAGANKIMGKDDFLKLMMLQMQYQDPLDPMDNEAMLAQMAQFTSLEQQANLNDLMKESNSNMLSMEATRFLGQMVTVDDPAASVDEPKMMQSRVQSVAFTANGPTMTLENGMDVTLAEIRQVSSGK